MEKNLQALEATWLGVQVDRPGRGQLIETKRQQVFTPTMVVSLEEPVTVAAPSTSQELTVEPMNQQESMQPN